MFDYGMVIQKTELTRQRLMCAGVNIEEIYAIIFATVTLTSYLKTHCLNNIFVTLSSK
jgi:hypothetical protein